MKAIYLIKYGESHDAFEYRDIPEPVVEEETVKIKVASSGLNFADVLARRGLYPDAPKNPAVLGYDVAGTITEVGKGVKHLHPGQRVTALTRFGGYAEYVTTMQEGVSPIPDEMGFEEATALATQGCTAYFCTEECTRLHTGDRVLIQAAAGGVGMMLVQLAKHRGCNVFGTASSRKIDKLRDFGVDYPIDYTTQDFTEVIRTHGSGTVDVVFDSIGGKTFKKGFKLLAPGGRMISFGAASQMNAPGNKLKALGVAINFGLFSPIPLLMQSKSIITVNMLRIADHRPHVFQKVLYDVVNLAKKGILKPEVGKSFDASDIAEAHNFLESRKSTGKVTLTW